VIRCQEAAELIPLHVGDDLPAEEARRVEEHLDQCALCVAEYESFAAARDLLVDLRAEMPARGSLWAGVASGLESAGPESAAAEPRAASRVWTWVRWTSAAAAALVAMVVLPPLFSTSPASGEAPAGEGPMIQATTPEELQEFILRQAAMLSPVTDPALNPAGSETVEGPPQDLPLTTPASNRPPRRF